MFKYLISARMDPILFSAIGIAGFFMGERDIPTNDRLYTLLKTKYTQTLANK
jgi:hypothetical protein